MERVSVLFSTKEHEHFGSRSLWRHSISFVLFVVINDAEMANRVS